MKAIVNADQQVTELVLKASSEILIVIPVVGGGNYSGLPGLDVSKIIN